ncbi:hypothetical protein [Actinoplanes subglobosus]|uniref:Carboxypeptidase regulatory-like domain-containing protein n=1 Tax=Actinoplanes subglobosus TaxID=1547892 RepID=A0ABV8J3D9_9ACTN
MRAARLVIAVLTAATVVMFPSAAQAADGPEIQYATSQFESETGVLLVGIWSEAGVAAVHADVKNGSGEVIASTDAFSLDSDQEEFTVWATQEPFLLPELGYYPVDVRVTDNNGVTTTRTDAGTLSYVVATFFDSVTVKPATATYEKRTVTVSGVLKERRPGTREIRRVPAAAIELMSGINWRDTTTGPDGGFSAEVPITESGRRIFVNFPYDSSRPYHLSSSYDTPDVLIKPRATRVTSTVTAKRVKAGESITVSGVVSWKTPAGWVPVSTGRVNVSACNAQDICTSFEVVPVAADGTYSLTLTPYETTTLRSYYIPPYREDGYMDPFVAVSQRDVPIVVLQKSSIPRFRASRESSGAVLLTGSVEFAGHLTPGTIPVEFQFSETGAGDWLTVGDDDQSYWDGEGGYEFEGRLTESRSGWWRARYPGDPQNFAASASTKIYVP